MQPHDTVTESGPLFETPAPTPDERRAVTFEPPSAQTPDQALPIARVSTGMSVEDAAGETIGTVEAVQMPGTEVRPDAPAGTAEHMMSAGYLRVDSDGPFTHDVYVSGDQIAGSVEGEPGVVSLSVLRDALRRAG